MGGGTGTPEFAPADPSLTAAYELLESQETLIEATRARTEAELRFRDNTEHVSAETEEVHPVIAKAWSLITGR